MLSWFATMLLLCLVLVDVKVEYGAVFGYSGRDPLL